MPFCVSLIFDKNVSKFKEVQLASVGLKRRWVNSQNVFSTAGALVVVTV